MLNEWQEFLDYTGQVTYRAEKKQDTAWLGRFTFEALRDFTVLHRVLTILARGFLFHDPNGNPVQGNARERIDFARRGLCAWCSIPEKAGSRKEWQYPVCFAELYEEFPTLVDADGWGWFPRHFHAAMRFVMEHPKLVRQSYADSAKDMDDRFDQEWRNKVCQFQIPTFTATTVGAWTLRFDDLIAEALERGPLRSTVVELPDDLASRLESICPDKLPLEVLETVVAYYLANRPDDSDWVVLPVTAFDCYFGDTKFGRKYLSLLPGEVIERSSSYGVSRYRVKVEYMM